MFDDLEFLTNQLGWPCDAEGIRYCVLQKGRQRGFLYEGSWNVHGGNIFAGGDGSIHHYDGPKEVIGDGWRVD